MRITLNEQEVVDAVAVYVSQRDRIDVMRIAVNLHYEERRGFWAEADVGDRLVLCREQDLIDAVAVYLHQRYGMDPYRMEVELHVEEGEGFGSHVDYRP